MEGQTENPQPLQSQQSDEVINNGSNAPSSPLLTEGAATKKFRQTNWRWLMLVLACFLLFGSYYCYDNPQALRSSINRKFGIDSTQFSLLYTLYSLPNIVLPFFGGIFIDKIGVRPAIVLFSVLLLVGQIVFAFSAVSTEGVFWMALLGRIIFGLGGESLNVARWFKGKELAMSLGVAISISRLASVVNDNVEPLFGYESDTSQKEEIFTGLILGAIFCAISLVVGFVMNCLDKYADRRDHSEGQLTVGDQDKFSFRDLKKLNCLYYLIITNCLLSYICVFPFLGIATSYFQVRFGLSEKHAGTVVSTTYIISGVLTPFLGLLVDKIGKRPLLILISDLALILSHVYLLVSPHCQDHECYLGLGGLIILGLSFSLYASVIWPSIALIVEPKILGTAYGMAMAIQNGGLALGPYLAGVLIDNQSYKNAEGKKVETNASYIDVSYMMIAAAGLSIIVGMLIWIQDCRTGNKLTKMDKKQTISNMLASPTAEERQQIMEDSGLEPNIKAYLVSPRSKNSLRRSFYGGNAK